MDVLFARYRIEARRAILARARRELRFEGRQLALRPDTPLSEFGPIDREWVESAVESVRLDTWDEEGRDLSTLGDLIEWAACRTLLFDLDEGVLDRLDHDALAALLACPARGVRMEVTLRLTALQGLIHGIPLSVSAGSESTLSPQEQAALARMLHWRQLIRSGVADALEQSGASEADYLVVRSLIEDDMLLDGTGIVGDALDEWLHEQDQREFDRPKVRRRMAAHR